MRGIFIIAPSRFGTSALAGVLHHLGADSHGGNSLRAIHGNPRGQFEDEALRRLHDDLEVLVAPIELPANFDEDEARSLGRRYVEMREKEGTPWVAKDPRLCVTAPYIVPSSALVLVPHRGIHAAAASWVARGNVPNELPKWKYHILGRLAQREEFLESFQGKALHFSYNALVDSPTSIISELLPHLPFSPTQAAVDAAVAFVEPSLRHHDRE